MNDGLAQRIVSGKVVGRSNMTPSKNTKAAPATKPAELALEEQMITAEEIMLFEDLQAISQTLSKTSTANKAANATSAEALAGWGYDIAERLNSGILTVETLRKQFRLTANRPKLLQFRPIGELELWLERDELDKPWHQHVEHLQKQPVKKQRKKVLHGPSP